MHFVLNLSIIISYNLNEDLFLSALIAVIIALSDIKLNLSKKNETLI